MEKLNLARPAPVEQGDYSVVGKLSFRNGVRPHLLLLAFPLKTRGGKRKGRVNVERGETASHAHSKKEKRRTDTAFERMPILLLLPHPAPTAQNKLKSITSTPPVSTGRHLEGEERWDRV